MYIYIYTGLEVNLLAHLLSKPGGDILLFSLDVTYYATC